MSASPKFFLLLKRIGTYLAKAEAKGTKEKRELKMAREAYQKIWESFYAKPTFRCAADHPRQPDPN